jgi:hypothetical protein
LVDSHKLSMSRPVERLIRMVVSASDYGAAGGVDEYTSYWCFGVIECVFGLFVVSIYEIQIYTRGRSTIARASLMNFKCIAVSSGVMFAEPELKDVIGGSFEIGGASEVDRGVVAEDSCDIVACKEIFDIWRIKESLKFCKKVHFLLEVERSFVFE